MTIAISNEHLSAIISDQGAELQSLTAKRTGEQYLWQGDATVWSGRAPILFPIVGMLANNTLLHNGQRFELPKHGLARQAVFQPTNQTENIAVFKLCASAETLRHYPWQFELQVAFTLTACQLHIAYQVSNRDSSEMIFTIGSHPAFSLPLQNATLTDYLIEFEKPETLERFSLNADGLLGDSGQPYLEQQTQITLSADLFNNDALIFKNIESQKIHLLHKQLGRRLTLDTGGAPHLGLWAKPGAAYVCIEPWFGFNSAAGDSPQFNEKPSMQRLSPGSVFDTSISIEIPH